MATNMSKAPMDPTRMTRLVAPLAALAVAALLTWAPPALAKGEFRLHSDPAGPTGRAPKPPAPSGEQFHFKAPKIDPVVIPKLPRGHVPAPWHDKHWHKDRYYYHHGHFFRHYDHGYIYVAPPPGVVVPFLPPGFTTMVIGGADYYYYQGNYYSRVPTGYLVVAPPPAAPFAPEPVPMPAPAPDPAPAPSVSPYGSVTITAPSLNVRTGPGREYNVVTVIPQGGIYTVQATSPNWVYIQLPDGQFGWVERIYTAPATTPAPSG